MAVRAKRKRIMASDAVDETESRVEGQQYAPAFCVANAEALIQLIATYSDDEAETALATLREAFWGQPGSFEKWQRQADAYLRHALGATESSSVSKEKP
jgi:hypothetical protein